MKRNVLLLLTTLILGAFAAPLSIKAQCPGATRQLTNSKAQLTNDAIGAVMINLLSDGSDAVWRWEAGTTFTENTDGTARIKGVLANLGAPSTHRWDVDITLVGQTFTPPMGSPVLMNTTPASTVGWYYYDWGTGSMTGLGSLAGGKINVARRSKFLQVGIGGSDQVADAGKFSGTGWFSWTVASQPTNSAIKLNAFPGDPAINQADIAFQLSGTPTVCGDPCANATAPTINCAADLSYTAASNGCATISYSNPSAGGATVTVESGPASGSCQKAGNYEVVFKATNTCNKTARCTLKITVKPYVDPCANASAPSISCGSALTYTAASNGCAEISYSNPSADGTVTVESGPASGSCQKAGSYEVVFKATNDCNKTARCTLKITVKPYVDPCANASAPSISCGSALTYTAASNGCAAISYSNPSAGDATVTVESGPANGSCQKAGSYEVVFKATNDCNKTARCTLKITVNPYVDPCTNEKEKPTFKNCPSNITMTTGNSCERVLWTAPTATDNCSTPTVTITSAPVSNRGNGSCYDPGIHTITYTATDASGNTATCSFTITITSTCAQVTDPGTIKGDDSFCPGGTISGITAGNAPSGGTGAIEYLWMYSTESSVFDPGSWTVIPGESGASLSNMPALTRTGYFIRCVRRTGCNLYKESNIVTKTSRASATITAPFEACVGSEVTFTAADVPGALFSWTFAGALPATVSGRTAKVKYSTAGTFKVTLEVAGAGCFRSASQTINVRSCLLGSGLISSFNTSVVNASNVRLNWSSQNELAPSMYVVESSVDGKNFLEVADIKSQNNEKNNYTYELSNPKKGRSFYRIKQIQSNGQIAYTDIQQAVIFINGGDAVLAYPNPIKSSLFVEVLDVDNTDGLIEIYNNFGKLMVTQKYTKDQMRYELDTETLPSGNYVLKIRQADGMVKSAKIVKF